MPDIAAADLPSRRETRAATSPRWRHAMFRLAQEPLLHFCVLGAAAFLAWPLLADRVAPPERVIAISAAQIRRAADIFTAQHARPPDAAEMAQLVDQEIRAEVFTREGLALGLDQDDEIIRRRIQQKMRFMVADTALARTPTDAELQAFIDAHPALYAEEPQFAFAQVYLDPARHGAALAADLAALKTRLRAGNGQADYGRTGDPLPLPNELEATPLRTIAGMFGQDFANALDSLPRGEWSGPIRSGFGEHLVLIRERRAGRPPALARIRDAVLRDWQAATREAANEAAYAAMRAKYTVRVDTP